MKSELDAISDQGQTLIKRYGSLRDFLIQDENIALVDDYICLQGDTEAARRLAITQVMEKAAALALNSASGSSNSFETSNAASSSASDVTSTASSIFSTAGASKSTNVWNDSKSSSSSNGVDALLQLPELDSLFDYTKKSSQIRPIQPPSTSVVSIPTSFPVPPPPLDIKNGSFLPSLIKPPIGYSSAVAGLSAENDFEAMNCKLQGLTASNSDLKREVSEKNRVIQALSKLVPDPNESKYYDNLEKELKVAKEEIAKLKADKQIEQNTANLVLSLQKQLEKEAASSRKLQLQLDSERSASAKILEKHNAMVKYCNMSGLIPPTQMTCLSYNLPGLQAGSSAPLASTSNVAAPSFSNNRGVSMDSLGLRSIWNNAKSDQQPVNNPQRLQNFSSSVGNVLMASNNKPNGSQLNNGFASSPFDYGGVFAPMAATNSVAPPLQIPPPPNRISMSQISNNSSSTSSSLSSASPSYYGSHKCL